jgi:hypothetical protein
LFPKKKIRFCHSRNEATLKVVACQSKGWCW